MTERTPWERVDAPAATPGAVAGPVSAGPARGAASRRDRLRRSRSPVIASFDGGGDVFQRRMRTLLVGSAALLGPLVAINLWVTVVGFDRFDPDDALFPSLGSGTNSGIEDLAPFVGAVATSLATAIVGWLVAEVVLADRAGVAVPGTVVALGRTMRALPRCVAAWVLGHWWQPLIVLVVVSADPDDLAGVFMFLGIGAWFAAAATLFTVPAMVIEGLGPVAGLRRSWRLFRRSSGTALSFVAASTLLGSLYLVGVGTLAPLLEANGFIGFGGAAWIVQGVLVQLAVLLVMPLIAACTTQCYLEARLDREALDLELDATVAFGDDGERDALRDGAPV